MKAYRLEKEMGANGYLQLEALPFQQGEPVEVIVLRRDGQLRESDPATVRGTVVAYVNPTEPVGEGD